MVWIVGIGETEAVRRSPDDLRTMVEKACRAAIDDAGLNPADIDAVVTDTGIMPLTVPMEWVSAQFGIESRFHGGISTGGAGIVGAPVLARMLIESGMARSVLCYFGVDWGTRPGGPYAFHEMYPAKNAFEKPYGFSAQPIYFGMLAQRYAREYGMPCDYLALIATAMRENAAVNGRGQIRQPMDEAQYCASRMISEPLRAADCCLISDGAGAFVMASDEIAARCRKPVRIAGCGFASEPRSAEDLFTQGEILRTPGADLASRRAQEQAGLSLDAMDFAQIYDCFSISCLLQLEDIGFCGKGEGMDFVRQKGITVAGGLPVNTHGGLLAHSYRLGIEHVTEAVRQLRGEAGPGQVPEARLGLVSGYSPPDYSVMILAAS